MSIASGFEKIKDRILTSAGYKLRSLWTSAQTVEMDDGTYLQNKIESMDAEIDGKAPVSHTHTGSQIKGIEGSRALVSDSSGNLTPSTVTSTELGYLDGVTSNIQTQLNTLNSNLDKPLRITRIQDPQLGTTYTLDYNVSDFRLIVIETNGHLPQYEVWCRQAVAVYGDAWYGTDGMRNDASIITENPDYYVLLRFEFVSPNQIKIVQKILGTFTNCALRIYGIK